MSENEDGEMSARDELARLLYVSDFTEAEPHYEDWPGEKFTTKKLYYKLADAVLAAGWTKQAGT